MKFLYVLLSIVALTSSVPVTYDQRQDGSLNVRADLQNIVLVAVIPKLEGTAPLLLSALSKTFQARKGLKNINRRTQSVEHDETEQEKVDARIVEPFLEPKTPYQVDISEAKSNLAKLYPPVEVSEAQTKSAHSPLLKLVPVEESPIPNVVPVKDNKYVTDRIARDEDVIEIGVDNADNVEELHEGSGDEVNKINRDSGFLLLGATEQCGPDGYRDADGICRLISSANK